MYSMCLMEFVIIIMCMFGVEYLRVPFHFPAYTLIWKLVCMVSVSSSENLSELSVFCFPVTVACLNCMSDWWQFCLLSLLLPVLSK